MAAAAAVVGIAGLALKIGGDVTQANAQAQAAQETAQGYDYDASVARNNAAITKVQTSTNLMKMGIMARRNIGAMSSGYAAAGVTRSGSAEDVLRSATSNYQDDVQNMKTEGALKVGALNTQSAFDTQKAGFYRQAGGAAGAALGFQIGGAAAGAYPSISGAFPGGSGSSSETEAPYDGSVA